MAKKAVKNIPKKKGLFGNVRTNVIITIVMLLFILLLTATTIRLQNYEIKYLYGEVKRLKSIMPQDLEAEKGDTGSINVEYYGYTYKRYSYEQFRKEHNIVQFRSIPDIAAYMNKNDYEGISVGTGYIEGYKLGNCTLNAMYNETLCDYDFIRYDQTKGVYIEEIKGSVKASPPSN